MITPLHILPGARGIKDMAQLLAVARAQGSEKLGVRRVRVLPWVERCGESYIVLVEPMDDLTHNSPDAGDKRTRE